MSSFDDNQLWHTPIKAYSDYLGEIERSGLRDVLRLGRFQKARETRALAILCFAMYKQMGTPWYLQLNKSEITDGCIMRNQSGTREKLNVEVTTYVRRNGVIPSESLLEQLKRTKTFSGYHKYGEHDLVLVDLDSEMRVDFEEIAKYLSSIDAPYELWTIERADPDNPDTIVQITTCTTKVGQVRLNIGEAWHEQMEKGIRGTVVDQRTADRSKVGIQPREDPITRAVWDFED